MKYLYKLMEIARKIGRISDEELIEGLKEQVEFVPRAIYRRPPKWNRQSFPNSKTRNARSVRSSRESGGYKRTARQVWRCSEALGSTGAERTRST